MSEHLKLVVHHGERARTGGRLTGDVVLEAVAGAGVAAAVPSARRRTPWWPKGRPA